MTNTRLLWKIIAGLVILVSLVFGMYQCENAKTAKLETQLANERASQAEKAIVATRDSARREISTIRTERAKETAEFESVLNRLKSSEKAKVLKYIEAKPLIREMTGGTSFLVITDELWAVKDSIIIATQRAKDDLDASYQSEIKTIELDRDMADKQSELKGQALVKSEKNLRREQRKVRLLKFTSVVLGTSTAILLILTVAK